MCPPIAFSNAVSSWASIDQVRSLANANPAVERMDTFHQRAVNILTSSRVREAFDLSRETEGMRSRYGANMFGQSLLMARRLVEAGTRFVQVKWYDWDGAWDIHGFNSTGIERMEEELCPRLDQGLTALLDDLHNRGLLASTLVVVMGEMGRTPRINHWGGRDHWGPSLFSLLAGGGVPERHRRRQQRRPRGLSRDLSGLSAGTGRDHLPPAGHQHQHRRPHPPLHRQRRADSGVGVAARRCNRRLVCVDRLKAVAVRQTCADRGSYPQSVSLRTISQRLRAYIAEPSSLPYLY